MAVEVILPQLGMTMEEGTILCWLKAVGERVEEGEPLLSITTDKADLDVGAPGAGELLAILVDEGTTVPVGRTIGWVGEPGETIPGADKPIAGAGGARTAAARPASTAPSTPTAAPTAASAEMAAGPEHSAAERPSDGRRILMTPAARRLARELGVDVHRLANGRQRVYRRHVIAAAQGTPCWQPLPPVRRTAAKRLTKAAATVPQFVLDASAACSSAERLRKKLGLSLTAIVLAAAGRALLRHPDVNVNYEERDGAPGVVQLHGSSVGVAVATDAGLIVPVIRDVAQRTLEDLAADISRLSERARNGAIRPDDLGGAALSVSNLGMFAITRFHAVVNPPESCILAVGTASGSPPALALSLSADHRALDGVQGASFLMDVVQLIEDPRQLMAGGTP